MAYNVASLLGTAIALPLLGVIAVILRFYVRLRLRPSYVGIDDWLIVLAVVLVVGHGVNQIICMSSYAFGLTAVLGRSSATNNLRADTFVKAAVIGELGRDDEPKVDWRVANEAKVSGFSTSQCSASDRSPTVISLTMRCLSSKRSLTAPSN